MSNSCMELLRSAIEFRQADLNSARAPTSSVRSSASLAEARTDGAVNPCKVVLLTPLKGKREIFSSLPSPRLQLLRAGRVKKTLSDATRAR